MDRQPLRTAEVQAAQADVEEAASPPEVVSYRPEEADHPGEAVDRPEEAGHIEAAEVDHQAMEDGQVLVAVARDPLRAEDPATEAEVTVTTIRTHSATACPLYRA